MVKKAKTDAPLCEARLLIDTQIDGNTYPCDSLIASNKKTIDALVRAGLADATEEAVTYKKENGAQAIVVKVEDAAPIVDEQDDADAAAKAAAEAEEAAKVEAEAAAKAAAEAQV